jgi:hypothetical protein
MHDACACICQRSSGELSSAKDLIVVLRVSLLTSAKGLINYCLDAYGEVTSAKGLLVLAPTPVMEQCGRYPHGCNSRKTNVPPRG